MELSTDSFEQKFMRDVKTSVVEKPSSSLPPVAKPPVLGMKGAVAALAIMVAGIIAIVVVVASAHPDVNADGGLAGSLTLDVVGSWVCQEGEGNHYHEAMALGVSYWFSPLDPDSGGVRYEFDKDGNFRFRVVDGADGAVEGIYQIQEAGAGVWQMGFSREYPDDWYLSTLLVRSGEGDNVLEFSLVGGGYILRCEKE